MPKLYGYARVSTLHQDLEIQLERITSYGVPEENIYSEKLSGKDMDTREKLKEVIKVMEPGDTLVVHKLDRLGRSVSQVTTLIDKLITDGRNVVIIDAGIDTRVDSNGMGGMMTKALITLLGLMAEMERTFILERTAAGRQKAAERGVTFGRRPGKKNLYDMAIEEYEKGEISVSNLIKKYSGEITESTFYRRLKKKRQNSTI